MNFLLVLPVLTTLVGTVISTESNLDDSQTTEKEETETTGITEADENVLSTTENLPGMDETIQTSIDETVATTIQSILEETTAASNDIADQTGQYSEKLEEIENKLAKLLESIKNVGIASSTTHPPTTTSSTTTKSSTFDDTLGRIEILIQTISEQIKSLLEDIGKPPQTCPPPYPTRPPKLGSIRCTNFSADFKKCNKLCKEKNVCSYGLCVRNKCECFYRQRTSSSG